MKVNKIYFITDKEIPSHKDKSIKNSKELITKYYEMEQPETYYLDEKEQCTYGRQRSFDDLYLLCKSRFPKTNKPIVSRALLDLCLKNKIGVLRCSDVEKIVFHKDKDWWSFVRNRIFNEDFIREYGNNYSPSFNDIVTYSKIKK